MIVVALFFVSLCIVLSLVLKKGGTVSSSAGRDDEALLPIARAIFDGDETTILDDAFTNHAEASASQRFSRDRRELIYLSMMQHGYTPDAPDPWHPGALAGVMMGIVQLEKLNEKSGAVVQIKSAEQPNPTFLSYEVEGRECKEPDFYRFEDELGVLVAFDAPVYRAASALLWSLEGSWHLVRRQERSASYAEQHFSSTTGSRITQSVKHDARDRPPYEIGWDGAAEARDDQVYCELRVFDTEFDRDYGPGCQIRLYFTFGR